MPFFGVGRLSMLALSFVRGNMQIDSSLRSILATALPFWVMVLFCISLTNCAAPARPSKTFASVYSEFQSETNTGFEVQKGAVVSLSVDSAPLLSVVRSLSDQSGKSIIVASSLDAAKVSLEVKNSPIDEVLSGIARRFDVRLAQIGNVYFLGSIQPEDRGYFVRRVRRLNGEGLGDVLKLFLSDIGRSTSFSDGLIVVADRLEVLTRLSSALDAIDNSPSSSWVIQLYLLNVSDTFSHSLGLDLSSSAKLSYDFASSDSRAKVEGAFSALLNSVHDSDDSFIVAQPLLVIRDGSQGILSSTQDVPIPRKTVSPQGTIETTGFDIVSAGLKTEISLRDETVKSCRAYIKVELGSISSFIEGFPVVSKRLLQTDVSIKSGGVYLVGNLSQDSRSSGLSGKVLPSVYKTSKDSSKVEIWCRCYRIGGLAETTGAAAAPITPSDKRR